MLFDCCQACNNRGGAWLVLCQLLGRGSSVLQPGCYLQCLLLPAISRHRIEWIKLSEDMLLYGGYRREEPRLIFHSPLLMWFQMAQSCLGYSCWCPISLKMGMFSEFPFLISCFIMYSQPDEADCGALNRCVSCSSA